jgi:hypothetical protein
MLDRLKNRKSFIYLTKIPQIMSTRPRSSFEILCRFTLAIAHSSESLRMQAPMTLAFVLFHPLELIGFLVVSHRRSRDQVHEIDEEKYHTAAADREALSPR